MKQTTKPRNEPEATCEAAAAYRALAEALSGVVFRTDGSGRFTDVGLAFAAWCGRPPADALGRTPSEVGGPAAALAAGVGQALSGGQVVRDAPLPNGRTSFVPVRDGRGRVTGLVGFIRPDNADAGRLERVRRTARGVAHDLNNLLTVMQTSASLLASAAAAAFPPGELLDSVDRAADHAKELTSRLLDLCRPDVHGEPPVDLVDVVAQVVTILRPTVGRRVRFELPPGSRADCVPGPRGDLLRVVLNLCFNACDAMPDGGTLVIRVEPVLSGAAPALTRLSVEDSGPGMPPEVRDRVFESGFTTKGVDGHSGFGLAFIAEVIRGRGGWVECHSALGLGTAFHVYLPSCPDAPAPVLPSVPVSSMPRRTPALLLADDPASGR